MEELKQLRNGTEVKNEEDRESSEENEGDIFRGSTISVSKTDRGVWGNRAEFFLAIMGYTVGIGSVWRFPIMCSRNGGGAFLIPFFTFLVVIGGPLYYLEVCLGQFTGLSAGLAFEFCPLFKGLGLLQVVLSGIVLWYSIFILTWSCYFLYWSFFPTLPWTLCDQQWNTKFCFDSSRHDVINDSLSYNITSVSNTTLPSIEPGFEPQSSSFEFWEYNVIGRSAGFHEPGTIQIHLAVCLMCSWIFVVGAVIKGVKTLGKVVYVTATVPYLMLTIMFIRGLTLDGAVDGILYYLTPDFSKLAESQVWVDAAVQVFYSLGPCWGGVITMASYNRFHDKSFWSSTMCVVSSGFTSFYNGLVVFTIIGFMAKETGLSVDAVAKQSGPGLTFVAFPIAISKLPLPQLWSVLFFLTLITVVFDSIFGELETVTSCLVDSFPRQLIQRRVMVNICVGIAYFLTGLPLTLNSGIYLFQLCDWYFSRFALMFGALLECIAIGWIYGIERFSRDIHLMTGRDVSVLLRLTWVVIIPLLALAVFLVNLIQYTPPDYGDGYQYSSTSIGLAILAGLSPIITMIIVGIRTFVREKGPIRQRLTRSLRPSVRWRPNDSEVDKTYKANTYLYPAGTWRKCVVDICGADKYVY